MLPNAGDDRTGANPTVRGFVGIVIVESAAGGVGAIEVTLETAQPLAIPPVREPAKPPA